MTTVNTFGEHLRSYRKRRGMSQLQLATAANSTPRYISFIETGRSRPKKDIILRLSNALNLTLREKNTILLSAGLPAMYSNTPLNDKEMEPVYRIIKQVLKNHDPFPAWSIAPGLHFLDSNAAAEKLYPGLVGVAPKDLINMWCAPSDTVDEKTRAETIFHILDILRNEIFHYPHPDLPDLLQQVQSYATGLTSPTLHNDSPIICSTILFNDTPINTLTTVMRFDKAVNINMEEIRIELIFPADAASEAVFREAQSE